MVITVEDHTHEGEKMELKIHAKYEADVNGVKQTIYDNISYEQFLEIFKDDIVSTLSDGGKQFLWDCLSEPFDWGFEDVYIDFTRTFLFGIISEFENMEEYITTFYDSVQDIENRYETIIEEGWELEDFMYHTEAQDDYVDLYREFYGLNFRIDDEGRVFRQLEDSWIVLEQTKIDVWDDIVEASRRKVGAS